MQFRDLEGKIVGLFMRVTDGAKAASHPQPLSGLLPARFSLSSVSLPGGPPMHPQHRNLL